jgi:DNA modification methylase
MMHLNGNPLVVMQGDVVEQLALLEDESVQCCVCSPPYWGLRDYGTANWEGGDDSCDHKSGRFERGGLSSKQASNNGSGGDEAKIDCPKCGAKRIDAQLGLEKTPEQYVAKMVEIFREVRRVLRRDGTLWVNLGDTYNANTGAGFNGNAKRPECARETQMIQPIGLPPKNLIGIPWRVAFGLQADGWYLRQDIIWAKPNPMPESVTDRCTKAHEYVFLLTKSARYFYDAEAIKEKLETDPEALRQRVLASQRAKLHNSVPDDVARIDRYGATTEAYAPSNRNKRSVWTVATAPYPEAHFATYPPDLIKPCILAGTSAKGCCAKCGAPWERVVERGNCVPDAPSYKPRGVNYTKDGIGSGMWAAGSDKPMPNHHYEYKTIGWQPTCFCEAATVPCTILDCFAGSGTTGAVALELGRKAVLIELNPKYVELIEERCNVTMGLALA